MSMYKRTTKDGRSLEVQEIALRNSVATEIYSDVLTCVKSHGSKPDVLMSVMKNDDTIVELSLIQ